MYFLSLFFRVRLFMFLYLYTHISLLYFIFRWNIHRKKWIHNHINFSCLRLLCIRIKNWMRIINKKKRFMCSQIFLRIMIVRTSQLTGLLYAGHPIFWYQNLIPEKVYSTVKNIFFIFLYYDNMKPPTHTCG